MNIYSAKALAPKTIVLIYPLLTASPIGVCRKSTLLELVLVHHSPSSETAPRAFPSPPRWPVCPPAQLAALHIALICECEFYQTSISSFESYPNGHFIVLRARHKLSAQYCAFPSIASPLLIPSPVL